MIGADGDSHGRRIVLIARFERSSFERSTSSRVPASIRVPTKRSRSPNDLHDPNRHHLRPRRSSACAAATRGSIAPTSPTCARAAGDIVQVRSPRGQLARLGALQRPIADHAAHADATASSRPTRLLVRQRIETAIAFRESLGIDATAYRLVHGEADLLPSLIVDRYGDYLVVQALSQGMDRLLPAVVAALDRAAAAARHPGAQRSDARACSKGWSSASTCSPARCRRR